MAGSKKIKKQDLAQLLSQWSQEFSLFVPSRTSGPAEMTEHDGQDTGFLGWYRNTIIPPKASFLPHMEEMFSFHRNKQGHQLELPPPEEQKRLIFAIRPCDARALTILDNVFEDAYQDPYYRGRRRRAILVGLGCTNPYDSCFCTSVGGGPSETTGVDIMLTDIGDELVTRGITKAGEELIAGSGLAKATKADQKRAEQSQEAARQKVTRKVDTRDMASRLQAVFDDRDYWQQIAAKCLSCGICTLLCPTCYCFDINDEGSPEKGTRCRSLDSCAFPVYTKMPMENPRDEKWRRVRNRLCHKYEFYPMLFDTIACTGCGRCIRLCPVNWDIAQILEGVPELSQAEGPK